MKRFENTCSTNCYNENFEELVKKHAGGNRNLMINSNMSLLVHVVKTDSRPS